MDVRTTEVRPSSAPAPVIPPVDPPSPAPAVPRTRRAAAVSAPSPAGASLEERGSFAHGACLGCDWIGPGRRARERARTDADRHQVVHHP